jgi:hypothetical protein
MCRNLVFIIVLYSFVLTAVTASAQGDTVQTTTVPRASEIMPLMRHALPVPAMPRIAHVNVLPVPHQYAPFMWTPASNLFDTSKLQLNLNFGKPQTLGDLLRDNPLNLLLLVVGTVAGMLNHQVVGIDKEIEIKTMHNVYTRTPIPESARGANNSFKTDNAPAGGKP